MRMKNILVVSVLALLIVIASSCSNDGLASDKSEKAYVVFGNMVRSLDTSYEVLGYDELYWFYKADKKDGYGLTGDTSDYFERLNDGKGVSGVIGPFSQGQWEFSLQAYLAEDSSTSQTGILVYESNPVTVTLKGGEIRNIPVSVTPVGDTGTIAFENADKSEFAYLQTVGEETSTPSVKVNLVGSDNSNNFTADITLSEKDSNNQYRIIGPLAITQGDSSTSAIPNDFYTCTITITIGEESYETSLSLRVFGNATTVITGNLLDSGLNASFMKAD